MGNLAGSGPGKQNTVLFVFMDPARGRRKPGINGCTHSMAAHRVTLGIQSGPPEKLTDGHVILQC